MLAIVFLVLVYSNTVLTADDRRNSLKLDEETLDKLRLPSDRLSTSTSYDAFPVLHVYQCAIACIRDKNSCTAYAFDSTNNLCSLFDQTTTDVDSSVTKLREELTFDACEKIKCKPDAICIGDDEAKCVCINGESTPENCDGIESGVWTDFNDWSVCTVTCGEGYRFRKRECLSANDKSKKLSNDHCIGIDTEIQPCEVKSCPTYGPWTPWTPCSTFCGIGSKQRNRSCIPPDSNCGNYTFEQRACGEANCQRVVGIKETEPEKYPMKGYLSIREGDILCVSSTNNKTVKHMADLVCNSIGFDRGAQYAVLNRIQHNATCYRGIVCDGTERSFYNCKYHGSKASADNGDLFVILTRCIVDGGFSAWSEWSACTKSCGIGQMTRSRTCTEPSPSILEPETTLSDALLAGKNCTGEYTQTKACNEQQC